MAGQTAPNDPQYTWLNAPKPQPQAPAIDPGAYTTPTMQPGQFQKQLGWLNNSKPSPAYQFWDDNKGLFSQPSFGEINAQGLVGQYSDPNNRPQVTDNAGTWFDQYNKGMATDPGLGAYYDNAKKRTTESINQTMAARGAYGSSAANDQLSRAYTDLDADRAKNEADYMLKRQGLGGQLASAADASSRARSQDEQAWTDLLGKLGIDSSRLGISRMALGGTLSANGSADKRNFGQDAFNNEFTMGKTLSDLFRSIMQPALDDDAAMLDKVVSSGVAQGATAKQDEANNANTTSQLISAYLNMPSDDPTKKP